MMRLLLGHWLLVFVLCQHIRSHQHSEIMEYLIKKLPKFGGTVIQTEDEIAAATMAIGANYGGVRALQHQLVLDYH